jgi:hypothetical protein
LVLTNRRLFFFPHRFDAATGGDSWECSLDAIQSVGIADRGWNPLDGSMRRRLEIALAGTNQFFVVSKVGNVVAHIESAVASR